MSGSTILQFLNTETDRTAVLRFLCDNANLISESLKTDEQFSLEFNMFVIQHRDQPHIRLAVRTYNLSQS